MKAPAEIACARRAALDLAARGLPSFPCRADKAPACPGGFKAATADPEALAGLWRAHPGPLIGVPTGAASGIDVLDLDTTKHPEAADWWCAVQDGIPRTRTHTTRSGGLHLLLAHSPGLRCWTGRPVPGVDGRSTGGYVVHWPGFGGTMICDAEPAPWPAWLLDAVAPPRRAAREPWTPPPLRAGGTRAERYAAAALRHAADRVALASQGSRNDTLNAQTFGLARFIITGLLDPQSVADRMAAAAFCAGLDEPEIRATLTSAFAAAGVE